MAPVQLYNQALTSECGRPMHISSRRSQRHKQSRNHSPCHHPVRTMCQCPRRDPRQSQNRVGKSGTAKGVRHARGLEKGKAKVVERTCVTLGAPRQRLHHQRPSPSVPHRGRKERIRGRKLWTHLQLATHGQREELPILGLQGLLANLGANHHKRRAKVGKLRRPLDNEMRSPGVATTLHQHLPLQVRRGMKWRTSCGFVPIFLTMAH